MNRGNWGIPLAVTGGALVVPLLPAAPGFPVLAALTLVSLSLLIRRRFRLAGVTLAAFCWCLLHYQAQLADRLAPEQAGVTVRLEGTVASVPRVNADFIQFRFRSDHSAQEAGMPTLMLLGWYRDWPELAAGERWRLEVRLKPPWGRVNFSGSDRERWLFAQGIGAIGSVRQGDRLAAGRGWRDAVQGARQRIGESIASALEEPAPRSIVQALAIADRSAMSDGLRQLLVLTGTSHLLAISGLHVGLAAMGGMLATRLSLWLLPLVRLGPLALAISTLGGLLCATAYALLADLGVSTLRALAMLVVVGGALVAGGSIHPLRSLCLAAAAVLLLDPFAPLGAGFWFSFLAVAALLLLFRFRTGRMGAGRSLFMAQSAVIVVLLPVSAAWFGGFSGVGFLANLAAIPWVSFAVVPPVLCGIALWGISPEWAGWGWQAAGHTAAGMITVLELLLPLQPELWRLAQPGVMHTALALTGALLLLLPRGMHWRWCALFLLLPLFLHPRENPLRNAVEANILDVGQGTAVLLRAKEGALLYDSGPAVGDAYDLVGPVIVPALTRLGEAQLRRVVISHADMDHAGGLGELVRRYPGALYTGNFPPDRQDMGRCQDHQHWSWGGTRFDVLHPSSGLPYLGNDSSCVVSVTSTGGLRLLLSGDISSGIEQRLVEAGIGAHHVLLVPHHGSKSSSGASFVARVQPDFAIATAGLGNRFGFPRDDTRHRYEAAGAKFWATGECGAIRLVLRPDGEVETHSARRQRKRIWRWPAADNCP